LSEILQENSKNDDKKHRHQDELRNSFRLGMQFDVNMVILSSLLDGQWIYSSVIIGVLGQLGVLLEGVQLFSLDLAQMICQRMDQKSLIPDHYVPSLEIITNIIII
jgi:hypothetical protein